MRTWIPAFAGMTLFVLCTQAVALDVPPKPTGYVSDWANILSPQARQNLEILLRDYELKTTNQLVVATFTSLEGAELSDFTIRAAEIWKVGQAGKDNGVILFVFIEDRKLRIEVGYGLEGVLPDALAELIIQQEIVPFFRIGQFDEGIRQGVAAIIKTIGGEYTPSEKPRRELTAAQIEALKARWGTIFRMLLAAIGAIFILDFFRYGKYRKGHKNYGERYSFWEWWARFAILFFILNLIFRIGFHMLLARGGGYHGSRGGFGGFSGGGGSFGGGGASGRW